MKTKLLIAAVISFAGFNALAQNDLIFIHHSIGSNWLAHSLETALDSKLYIDERNDISYGTAMSTDTNRPFDWDSLGDFPGDSTEVLQYFLWFNDYLNGIKIHGCANGRNEIIMFKTCYPGSNVTSDGTPPGNPFAYDTSDTNTRSIVNYQSVYRHYNGSGNVYSNYTEFTYYPLEDIFTANPDTLFIPITSPPYNPTEYYNSTNLHRARIFCNWLKNTWLTNYNAANPGLNNVAVFDLFDILANPDDDPVEPNALRTEYRTVDSHPNDTANATCTWIFATSPNNFIDEARAGFIPEPYFLLFIIYQLLIWKYIFNSYGVH